MKRLRVLALASYPVEAASSRYRIVQFIEPLARRGIDVTFSPFFDTRLFAALYKKDRLLRSFPRLAARTFACLGSVIRAARADVIFVQREAMLFGPPVIEWLISRFRPLVLDLDDATWIAYASPVYGRFATLLKWPSKTNRFIRWAKVVTCGSPNIAAYVRSLGAEAVHVPTVVDTDRFRPGPPHPDAVPIIGWVGTHGTYPFVERLIPIFERLAREVPFRVLIVGSGREEVRIDGVEVITRPWRMEAEVDDFQSIDVGVYPIADDAWSAGKAGLKAVQYMACGVPFVMSPVGVCATMGVPGETHLAAVSDDDWFAALRRLVSDAELHTRMSSAGRAFAIAHYGIEAQADALAAAMRGAAR